MSRFSERDKKESETPIRDEVRKFLRDPDKPIILAMARPDERKNLEMLVRVYGESEELRKRSNLVLVMGTRDDIRELPKQQRKVVDRILTLIDVYDPYGSISYPKTHHPSEVPDLYRMAKESRGVSVNPALTESFGLTLLEAANPISLKTPGNQGRPR